MVGPQRCRLFAGLSRNSAKDGERAEEEPTDDRFLAFGLCLAPPFISGVAACLAGVNRTYLCTALTVPAYRTLALAGAAVMALFWLLLTFSTWTYGRRRSGVFWPAAGVSLMVAVLLVWSVSLGAALLKCGGPQAG